MPTEKKLPLQKISTINYIPPNQLKEVGVFHYVLQKIKRFGHGLSSTLFLPIMSLTPTYIPETLLHMFAEIQFAIW